MYIVLRNLSANGFSWRLSETPLVIGRGHDCDIRVFDSEISRRHAKVWMKDGEVFLEDLGSSNATLLNGSPCLSSTLKSGDTISAGNTIFLIAEKAENGKVGRGRKSDVTPITISALGEPYRELSAAKNHVATAHRTIHELHDLFVLSCSLGAVESIGNLSRILRQSFAEKMKPEALWIAWCYGDDQPFVYDRGGEAAPDGPLPTELLQRARETREGLIEAGSAPARGKHGHESYMVVPLVHANEVLGGVALRLKGGERSYAEDELRYAMGIAAVAAPHIRAVRHAEQLRRDNRALLARSGFSNQLLGQSAIMEEIRVKINRAGASPLPVLILGETGTGKEVAARLLHEASPRREGPYTVVNCAAVPDHLFESEFFGHESGAFTGATKRHIGYFEEADGGTLFLDEVGDLSMENQARILRAVETKAFRRVGGTASITVDVRILSATNKDLSAPEFRLDLLHRLNGVTIEMPSLRDHLEDLPQLVGHFLENQQGYGTQRVDGIEEGALDCLRQYGWPGNVRELRATIERAIVFASGSTLSAADFSLGGAAFAKPATQSAQVCDTRDTSSLAPLGDIEREHIQNVVQACGGNVAKAARVLKINRATLYRKIAEYES